MNSLLGSGLMSEIIDRSGHAIITLAQLCVPMNENVPKQAKKKTYRG